MDWRAEFEAELDKGSHARLAGNEGRARVCARRAAGLAARRYFESKGVRPSKAGALDLLRQLWLDPELSPETLQLIDHLTQSVDEAFRLPPGVDLIEDARRLGAALGLY
jgi:hypothetical protein